MNKNSATVKPRKIELDKAVFWPSVIILCLIMVPCFLFPEAGSNWGKKIFHFISFDFDSVFEWFTLIMFILGLGISFSRYGSIKMGLPEETPDYSTGTWAFMLITGCSSAGLFYWGMVEPMYHITAPPFGIEPNSAAAATWGVTYAMFHWGPAPWAYYGFTGALVAYFYYVRREPQLKGSLACEGFLGKRVRGPLGNMIDIIVIISLAAGTAASLAILVPMIAVWAEKLLGIPRGLPLNIGIIVCWVAIFAYSVLSGINKGMKWLSDINVWAVFGLVAFLLIFGPGVYILSFTTESLGQMFQNFIKMSTWTDPVAKSGFPQNWTVFWWAFWAVYAVFLGIFVARISKARTFRQIYLMVVSCGTIGSVLMCGLLGSYTMYLTTENIIPMVDIFTNQGPEYMIYELFCTLPYQWLVWPLVIIVGFLSTATLYQSCAWTLASTCSKNLYQDEEPPRWHRLFWAILLGALAVMLTVLGGLSAVQAAAVIFAIPVLLVLIFMLLSFFKWTKEDFGDQLESPVLSVSKKKTNIN
jgi:BCCT family betaine/carnitine transporter